MASSPCITSWSCVALLCIHSKLLDEEWRLLIHLWPFLHCSCDPIWWIRDFLLSLHPPSYSIHTGKYAGRTISIASKSFGLLSADLQQNEETVPVYQMMWSPTKQIDYVPKEWATIHQLSSQHTPTCSKTAGGAPPDTRAHLIVSYIGSLMPCKGSQSQTMVTNSINESTTNTSEHYLPLIIIR